MMVVLGFTLFFPPFLVLVLVVGVG